MKQRFTVEVDVEDRTEAAGYLSGLLEGWTNVRVISDRDELRERFANREQNRKRLIDELHRDLHEHLCEEFDES